MCNLNEKLKQIVTEACSCAPRSAERQRCIGKLYKLVMTSGKLWQENSPHYSDALQETWEYCCQHLEDYDPSLSAVTTWINTRLQWTLKKWRDRQIRDTNRHINPSSTQESELLNPVDRLSDNSQVERAKEIWEETLNWVRSDPDGILQKIYFRDKKNINAQVLFLMRFPSETPWAAIAQQFLLTEAEAKDLPKFYNRKCLPFLRQFGIRQGYLDESKNE